ncbi:MAG TPA: sugar isomerase [Xanthobacteraceae bacterium]|jgi:D-sedoheptulose 7-phosphate isomerase|nr:sugar isomerase [Xanthobacteraceae bacterium]
MTHAETFLSEVKKICENISCDAIEAMTDQLTALRERKGRLFLLGLGGSAGNCTHAANDFRKLCGIEAYSAVDNVSELTARANDEGWDTIFSGWLEASNLNALDAILVFSVGGGDIERRVSTNIVQAVNFAQSRGAKVLGVLGRDNGYTALHGDSVVVVPQVNPSRITPLSEAFQAVVWHCLVSHPELQIRQTKW